MATTRRTQCKPWYADRSTGDLLIMGIAGTVCFSVLAAGGALALLTFLQPGRDVSAGFNAVGDVINTLIGLLAGFLAGRTDAHLTMTRQADGSRTWEADRSSSARSDVPADH